MAIKRNYEADSGQWHLALAGGIAVVALLLLGSVDLAGVKPGHSESELSTARIVSSELSTEWQAKAEASPVEFLELTMKH